MKIIRLTKTAADEHHHGAMGHPVGEPEIEAPKITPSKRPFNKAQPQVHAPKPAPVILPKQMIPEPVQGPVVTQPLAPKPAPVTPAPAPMDQAPMPEPVLTPGVDNKAQSLSWAPEYVKQMAAQIPPELISTVGPQDFDHVDSKGIGRAKTLNGLIFKMKTEPWEAASFAREALWFRASGGLSETGADKDTISHIIDKAHRKASGDDPEWAYQPDKIVELALRSINGNETNLPEIIQKIISSPSYRKKKGNIGVEDKVYQMTPEESSEKARKLREIESLHLTPEEKKHRIESVKDEFDDLRRKRVEKHYKGNDGTQTTHNRNVLRVMEARDYEKDPERYPVPEHIAKIQDYPERLMRLYQWHKYGLARGNDGIMNAMNYHNNLNNKVVQVMPLVGAKPSIAGGEHLKGMNGNWQDPKNALGLRYMRNNYKDFMKAYDALPKDSPLRQDPKVAEIVKALRSPENVEGGANNLVPEMFDPGRNHVSVGQFKSVLNSGKEQSLDVGIGGGEDDIKRDFGFIEVPTPILEETVHQALREMGHTPDDIKEEIARQTSYAGDKRQALEWILQEQAPEKLDALKKEHSSGMEDTRALGRDKVQVDEEKSQGSENRVPSRADMWQKPSDLESLMDVKSDEIKSVIGDDRLSQGLDTVKQILTDKKFYNQKGSVPESLRDPQLSIETLTPAQQEDLRKFMFSMRFKSRMNSLMPKAKDNGTQTSLSQNLDKLADETYGQYTGILRDISSLISGRSGVQGPDGAEQRLILPGARNKVSGQKEEEKLNREKNADILRRWFEANADKFQAPIRELGEDPGQPMSRFRKAYYKVVKDMSETLAVMPQERYDGLFGPSKVAKTDFVRMLRVARLACLRIA